MWPCFWRRRHERLDLGAWLAEGWRVKKEFAVRTIKTMCGPVRYGRAYLTRGNGGGWFPLDAALGHHPGRLQLAGRRSGDAAGYAGQLFRGTGHHEGHAWLGALDRSDRIAGHWAGQPCTGVHGDVWSAGDDGEVLVIEVDGKAAPMATEAELEARRRKRKHAPGCSCGCQRHRGRQRRRGKQKKRKKRGHNSKNGRSATLVAMYTLRRGEDGRLHGPINKKIWGQFGCRKDALQWARDQATRRGFGPDTDKRIQIVLDGERCLRKELQVLFPQRDLHPGRATCARAFVEGGTAVSRGSQQGTGAVGGTAERVVAERPSGRAAATAAGNTFAGAAAAVPTRK